MSQIDLVMPKMGESIMEATILSWLKEVGDTVEIDENIVEIATDKVDSEIPSPVAGVITEILYQPDDVVPVGEVIARISAEGAVEASPAVANDAETAATAATPSPAATAAPAASTPAAKELEGARPSQSDRFYSPLVRKIAAEEQISLQELASITGTGMNGRVTKHDVLGYLDNRGQAQPAPAAQPVKSNTAASAPKQAPKPIVAGAGEEIIQMDRMRKLIADHMVMSKHTSPHVTSFVEADVTNIVNWRNRIKKDFQGKYGEKITFTPIFLEAVVAAIRDFPLINISVQDDKIIKKNAINVGMAAALPSGNLIVPVIKSADQLNLLGLTRAVNDLANRARQNALKPDEIQGGTFTLTNVGTFGNVMGTPIINQPQVAVMAVGAIRKKPAVVETEYGDVIAIRHMMFLSLSYDHRVVDGMLGGSFLRSVADYLEGFDSQRTI